MASSNANRPPDTQSHNARGKHHERHHQHQQRHSSSIQGVGPLSKQMAPVSYLQHHLAAARPPATSVTRSSSSSSNFKGHQRRQSVARLLPDISKLRLLSWLVEASNELINCDIAIMDGVYAKLNRSRESLLFWDDTSNSHNTSTHNHSHYQPTSLPVQSTSNSVNQIQLDQRRLLSRRPPPPLPPNSQPAVGQRLAVTVGKRPQSQHHRQSRKLSQSSSTTAKSSNISISSSPRNHHSLPITNYDASSLAAVLQSPDCSKSQRSSIARSSAMSTDSSDNMLLALCISNQQQQPSDAGEWQHSSGGAGPSISDEPESSTYHQGRGNSNQEVYCDSNQSDDDDSSAASSTTSSGIHGGGTSLSSGGSLASSPGSSNADSAGSAGDLVQTENLTRDGSSLSGSPRKCPLPAGSSGFASTPAAPMATTSTNTFAATSVSGQTQVMSSAEILSEKIRLTVMRHNYLQSLLVNIIRQHDKQRDLTNQRRRRLMSIDQLNSSSRTLNYNQLDANQGQHQERIDLMDIADALNDGCLCLCHSMPAKRSRCSVTSDYRASTLPIEGQQIQAPARKLRGLKKTRCNNSGDAGNGNGSRSTGQPNFSTVTNDMDRQDIIAMLSDKLCENCFETHYWLHSDPQELERPAKRATIGSSGHQDPSVNVSKKNATFIRLVQQEVRSTITKSIELIDLIRKEIKLPESIKQKQLMRCFSSSIQLLTSVSNYVVPAQDISTFIPDLLAQQETMLFSLPASDFDHIMLNPLSSVHNNQPNQHQDSAGYHLAQAPDIPIRRRNASSRRVFESSGAGGSLKPVSRSRPDGHRHSVDHTLSSCLKELNTGECHPSNRSEPDQSSVGTSASATALTTTITDTTNKSAHQESSSGASSNNSSASSSIARGTVQQSSLTRANTSNAIFDDKTSHDISFETMADLSGRRNEAEFISHPSRPKFWQSSKFNIIKKLLQVKEQRLLRQQSKDRRIYNNKIQRKFRLVMMDLTHFNRSQQLLSTENGVNSLLTSMRNVLEFGLYLTVKLY